MNFLTKTRTPLTNSWGSAGTIKTLSRYFSKKNCRILTGLWKKKRQVLKPKHKSLGSARPGLPRRVKAGEGLQALRARENFLTRTGKLRFLQIRFLLAPRRRIVFPAQLYPAPPPYIRFSAYCALTHSGVSVRN